MSSVCLSVRPSVTLVDCGLEFFENKALGVKGCRWWVAVMAVDRADSEIVTQLSGDLLQGEHPEIVAQSNPRHC